MLGRAATALTHSSRALRIKNRHACSAGSSDFDVVVAGGGVVGASVAYHLKAAAPALRVCVVERDPQYSHASAPRSAGGIRQQFSLRANIELSLYGLDFIRTASANLRLPGEDAPDMQFKEQGYLFLASEAGESTLRSNHATQRAAGASTTLLDPSALAARFPWLNLDGVSLGCFGEQGEGWFDPYALQMALRGKAREMGVTFVHGSVRGLECEPDVSADAADGCDRLRVTAVNVHDASSGFDVTIGAGHVVNAAGAFAAEIVNMCGGGSSSSGGGHASGIPLPVVAPLPVAARKRCIFAVNTPGGASSAAVPPSGSTPLVVDPSGVYFRPEGPAGRFLCGVSPPASHADPDCHDVAQLEEVDHSLFEEVIWPALYTRCAAFEALKVQASWSGFYEYNTVDQNAIIGRHPHVPNLVLCNGFSGHGLQQAPGAGRAVAELLVAGSYQTVDVGCFGFERFLRNEPVFEQNIV